MKFTEKQLQAFAAPLSDTEADRCKNAIRMIRDAMQTIGYTDDGKEIRQFEADTWAFALDLRTSSSGKKITLLVQGSYANNTNIRSQSDVDVAVILESTFIPIYRAGITAKDYHFADSSFSVQELKDEVERALNEKFKSGIERHDKSIKVSGNSYRVDADVVPAYRNRDYSNDFRIDPNNYIGGIEIRPDSGGRIINYPEQHIRNGRKKNLDTNHAYKKSVRIIKNIKEIMIQNSITSASDVCSFQLESLLWNIPNDRYNEFNSLRFVFNETLKYLINDINSLNKYMEANGVKKLFSDTNLVEKYKRFINDIKSFYEYDINEN